MSDETKRSIDFHVVQGGNTTPKLVLRLTEEDKLELGEGVSYDDAALMLASRGLNIEDYELEKNDD